MRTGGRKIQIQIVLGGLEILSKIKLGRPRIPGEPRILFQLVYFPRLC
jgi:hypothetical protein